MTISLPERISNRLLRLRSGWKSSAQLTRLMQGTVTCLLYHRVAEDGDNPWIEAGGVPVTSPESFRRQLSLLHEIGCRFLTLQQLAAGQCPEPGQPGVVVTFDDGFADNFRIAQPILDDAGIPAVFFVTSGLIEATECLWDHQICWYLSQQPSRVIAAQLVADVAGSVASSHGAAWTWRHLLTSDRALAVLGRLRQQFGPVRESAARELYGTWDHLRAAVMAGHEIGSHTVNHPMRHTLPEAAFETELVDSRRCLEQQLLSPVTSFSFPFNSYLFSDAELCRRCGYTAAATVEPGRLTRTTNMLDIPRRTVFRVHNRLSNFKALLAQERWE